MGGPVSGRCPTRRPPLFPTRWLSPAAPAAGWTRPIRNGCWPRSTAMSTSATAASACAKTLTVGRDIDFHTGNIVAIGDVLVGGSIRSGFTVMGRNVTVRGPVGSLPGAGHGQRGLRSRHPGRRPGHGPGGQESAGQILRKSGPPCRPEHPHRRFEHALPALRGREAGREGTSHRRRGLCRRGHLCGRKAWRRLPEPDPAAPRLRPPAHPQGPAPQGPGPGGADRDRGPARRDAPRRMPGRGMRSQTRLPSPAARHPQGPTHAPVVESGGHAPVFRCAG